MDQFFESLYSQFILRDLLGKVVPGLLTGISIAGVFWEFFSGIVFSLLVFNLSVGLLFVYGLSYILALALQYIGGRLNWIQIYVWPPDDNRESKELSLCKYQEILSKVDSQPQLLRHRERFALLKEMTGNFAMSFSVVSASLLLMVIGGRDLNRFGLACVIPLTVSLAFVLFKENHHHADEQLIWEKTIIEGCDSDKADA